MSSTEFHSGYLVEVQKDIEGFEAKVKAESIPESQYDYYDEDDYYLYPESGYTYLRESERLFKIKNHQYERDSFHHFDLVKCEEGLYFSTSFYNGGTCLEEMLEKNLKGVVDEEA